MKKILIFLIAFTSLGVNAQCDTTGFVGYSDFNIRYTSVVDSSICPCGYDYNGIWYNISRKFLVLNSILIGEVTPNSDGYSIEFDSLGGSISLRDENQNLIEPVQDDTYLIPGTSTPKWSYDTGVEKWVDLPVGDTMTISIKYFISPIAIVSGNVCFGLYGSGEALSIDEFSPLSKEIIRYISLTGQIISILPENKLFIIEMSDHTFRKAMFINGQITYV